MEAFIQFRVSLSVSFVVMMKVKSAARCSRLFVPQGLRCVRPAVRGRLLSGETLKMGRPFVTPVGSGKHLCIISVFSFFCMSIKF